MRQHTNMATRCTIAASLCVLMAGCGQGTAQEPTSPAASARSPSAVTSSTSIDSRPSEGRNSSNPDRTDIGADPSVDAAASSASVADEDVSDSGPVGSDDPTTGDTSRGTVSEGGDQTTADDTTDSGTAPDNIGDGSTDAHNLVMTSTI